jgi:hypothetical protein
VKINANKRKQNSLHLLSFTSVYFSESGLFKGLRPIQIKKIPAPVSGCVPNVLERIPPPGRGASAKKVRRMEDL